MSLCWLFRLTGDEIVSHILLSIKNKVEKKRKRVDKPDIFWYDESRNDCMLFHKTTRKFKTRHASNKSGVKPDEKKRISLLCAISMNVSKSIYPTNGRQFGWILDQSLMDINAMIIMMMMMMITQQYKHKVAIELTLSRNYNKYDIIIIKAHLWLSLSSLTVCMWVRACHLLLSQFYFVGICNRHNGNTFFVDIIYCIYTVRIFLPCLV